MKYLRQTLPIVALTALSVALLAGCGGTEDSKTDAPTDVVLRYVDNIGAKKEIVRKKRVVCGPENRSELCEKVESLPRKSLKYDVAVGDCFPAFGSASSGERDKQPCRSVRVRRSPLDPVPPTVPCTLVGGFEIDASVTGRIDGKVVNAKYLDAYNCDSERWNKVEDVFLEAGVLNVPVMENPPYSISYPTPEAPEQGDGKPIPVN